MPTIGFTFHAKRRDEREQRQRLGIEVELGLQQQRERQAPDDGWLRDGGDERADAEHDVVLTDCEARVGHGGLGALRRRPVVHRDIIR